jgi:hypothetical protein
VSRESPKSILSSPHYSHFPGSRGNFVGSIGSRALAFPAALAMLYWRSSAIGNDLATLFQRRWLAPQH